jgi:hypothetical protein
VVDAISLSGLITALLLPWLLGSLLVYRLLLAEPSRNLFLVVGHGYIAGMFIGAMVLRAVGTLTGSLPFWPVAALLLLLVVACVFAIYRRWELRSRASPWMPPRFGWQWVLALLLLGLIAVRLVMLGQELMLRPLYPWDAWMNWVPKAAIWFERGELVGFVNPGNWLTATDRAATFTLGNWRASEYPEGLPLISLWTMLGAHTSAHPWLGLPWLIMLLALASAFFGHLRLLAVPTWLAILAVFMLTSIPYVNVHTALAGYADLWLAGTFSLAFFCLHAGEQAGNRRYTLMALFLALVCTQLKVPGLLLAAIILIFAFFQVLRMRARHQLLWLVALVCLVVTAVLVGVRLEVPGLGNIAVGADFIQLPMLERMELAWHPVQWDIADTLFRMSNWHLLWYCYVVSLGVFLVRGARRPGSVSSYATAVLMSVVATAAITLVFFLTPYYQQALDFTTVNRAYLYVVPLALYSSLLVLFAGAAPGAGAGGDQAAP